uniref:ladderlectin-like n=1 Tax=Semicossyphus pulcher TaxID=241346 RepID=UPI0037E7D016
MEAEDPEARFNLCPRDWISYGSRCFHISSSYMTWYSAEEHCNSLGAQLASATSPQEYAALQQMTRLTGQSTAWLGGFNLQGQWMWIDRQGYYFDNFYAQSSVSTHPCIFLQPNHGWGNTNCGSVRSFICSRNMFGC